MTTLKQQNKLLWTLLIILLVILVGLTVVGYRYIVNVINISHTDNDKVCMPIKTYHDMQRKHSNVVASPQVVDDSRDRRVLNDPLYPALNRSEFDVHNGIVEQIKRKNLYNTTQEFTDRYRLVAYVTNHDENKDSGGNVWKLMARQKNRNQGEFFLVPANNNYDMKIMLNNDIITGEKLKDIYTIPKQLTFKTPLLNETPYEVSEIPMNDFTNSYN